MTRFLGKGIALLLALVLTAMFLCACSPNPVNDVQDVGAPETASGGELLASGTEIALLTTEERLESDFGQGVWNSIARFAGESGASSGYYKTEPDDPDAALSTLELAVRGGASLVVCMDAGVSGTVAGQLQKYSDVQFILLDAPADTDLRQNAVAVRFSPEQAGFLAGYAAVYEEHSLLGVAAGADEESGRYALGFLMGAETAASERKMQPESLKVIWLAEGDDAAWEQADDPAADSGSDSSDDTSDSGDADSAPGEVGGTPLPWRAQVAGLFERGAGLVFAAQPDGQALVLKEATSAGGKMMGIELDLTTSGQAALGSIEFDPRQLVYDLLTAWRDGTQGGFAGGTDVVGGVAEGAVLLETDPGRFENAREWILTQGPLRFEDGTLAARLERRLTPVNGELPSPGSLSLTYLVVLSPARYDALLAQEAAAQQQNGRPSGESDVSAAPEDGSGGEAPVPGQPQRPSGGGNTSGGGSSSGSAPEDVRDPVVSEPGGEDVSGG